MVVDRDAILSFLFRLVPPGVQGGGPAARDAASPGRSAASSAARRSSASSTRPSPPSRARSSACPTSRSRRAAAGVLMAIPFFGPFVAWAPPVIVALLRPSEHGSRPFILMGVGWLIVMNVLQPRLMQEAVGIHPIVVLGSVLIGSQDRRRHRRDLRHPDRRRHLGVLLPLPRHQPRTVAGRDRAAKRVEAARGPAGPGPARAGARDRPGRLRHDRRRSAGRAADAVRDDEPPTRRRGREDAAGHDPGAGPDRAARPRQGARRAGRRRRRPRRPARPAFDGQAAPRLVDPAEDPDHERRRRRVARATGPQAGARADRRHDGRRARHEPERRRPPEDADATAPRPGADARRRLAGLLGRRLPDRRGQHRLPRLLRPRLRPGRGRHQLRREPRRRHHLLRDGQRGDGGGDQQLPRRSRSRRSTTSIPTSRSRRWPPRPSPATSSSTACRAAS